MDPAAAKLARMRREADRGQQDPKNLWGFVVAQIGLLPAGFVQIRLQDGGLIQARQLDDAGHPQGTKVRITAQGGLYYAAGPSREGR